MIHLVCWRWCFLSTKGVVLSWDRDTKRPTSYILSGYPIQRLNWNFERCWNRKILLLSLLWPFAWLVAFLLICTSWVPPHRVIRRAIQHGLLTAALLLMCNTTKYSSIYLPPYFATPMCSIVSKSLVLLNFTTGWTLMRTIGLTLNSENGTNCQL